MIWCSIISSLICIKLSKFSRLPKIFVVVHELLKLFRIERFHLFNIFQIKVFGWFVHLKWIVIIILWTLLKTLLLFWLLVFYRNYFKAVSHVTVDVFLRWQERVLRYFRLWSERSTAFVDTIEHKFSLILIKILLCFLFGLIMRKAGFIHGLGIIIYFILFHVSYHIP